MRHRAVWHAEGELIALPPRFRVDEEKAGASKTFFTKVKEELDIIPAKAQVIEYWQEKVVFDQADGQQRTKATDLPVHPLVKCIASVQLAGLHPGSQVR